MVRKTGFRIQDSGFRTLRLFCLVLLIPGPGSLVPLLHAQQPQTSAAPIYAVNAKYVQGVGPGYWPTAGSGLTLNVATGTAVCNNAAVNYAGGTLPMTDASTNYVFLDPAATCVPAKNITGFSTGHVPLATVVTAGGSISTVTDLRTWLRPFPCTMNATGAVICAALGTNQNITLTPSGTGFTLLGGDVGIGTANPLEKIHVYSLDGTQNLFESSGSQQIGLKAAGVNAIVYSGKVRFGYAADPQTTFWPTTDTLTLDVNGNVGIGKTTGIAQQLDVVKSITSGLNVATFSATPTFDASLGNTQKITLTNNVTSSTLSNASAGQTINFLICQDATGSRTFVWPTNVKGGMTVGSTLSTCSAQNFIFDGTNAYALSAGVTNM